MRLQFRGQLARMLTDELVNGLLGLDFDCGCVHAGTYQTRLELRICNKRPCLC